MRGRGVAEKKNESAHTAALQLSLATRITIGVKIRNSGVGLGVVRYHEVIGAKVWERERETAPITFRVRWTRPRPRSSTRTLRVCAAAKIGSDTCVVRSAFYLDARHTV